MEKETILDKITKVVTIAGNFIMMNLLFLVACLPIVTIGQAYSGLISALRYNIRGDKWLDGFKKGFKTRFWRGTVTWLVMLLLTAIAVFDMLTYSAATFNTQVVINLVMSCLMFAVVSGLTVALLFLNVYIPTATGQWIRNAVNMVFKAPLQLVVCGVVLWLPALLALFYFKLFYYCVMIFLAAYFTLAVLCMTMLLKDTLVFCLLEARADGTLLSEDGKIINEEEDDGEV